MKTFSVNGAAEVLEKDRRTLVRALRHTKPDAHEGRHPRWRMTTILGALELNAPRPERHVGSGDQLDEECKAAFAKFDGAFEKMLALPSLVKRREMAIKFAPTMITEAIRAMRARDAGDELHPDHVDLRGDRVFFLMMIGFETSCEWTRDQVWENLSVGDDD
jgi:hypothetical protein